MIRSILGTRRIDNKKIETMYEKTKMQNIMIHIKQMKWRWAGLIMRLTDERWTKKITELRPINKTRNRGRPA